MVVELRHRDVGQEPGTGPPAGHRMVGSGRLNHLLAGTAGERLAHVAHDLDGEQFGNARTCPAALDPSEAIAESHNLSVRQAHRCSPHSISLTALPLSISASL
jgi:hypothetical protein